MIDQLGIALFGVTAVFLSQDKRENWRRWACIFGLAAQPFWIYAGVTAGQWGIVFLSFLYGYGWFRGVRTHWWKS